MPVTNAHQGTFAGGFTDAFVAKFNPGGSSLVYSTYFGGSTASTGDQATAVAADSSGNAYVTGATDDSAFPTLNAYQPISDGSLENYFA